MEKNEKRTDCFVMAVHRDRYELELEGRPVYARLKTAIYYKEGSQELFPTVGDVVEILYSETGDSVIVGTKPRKSVFLRMNATPGMPDQAIAANFDYVFIVMSLNLDFHISKLERYLSAAWQSGGTPVVILSKADLCPDLSEYVERAKQTAPGVDIVPISVKTGEGLPLLERYLQPGKSVVLCGSSGVGKSSLLNALLGEETMATGEIREYDSQGRHTTTHRQCTLLPGGARIIDTPGMRKLLMTDARDGVKRAFADVETLMAQCRFADCTHTKEPGCAVQQALSDGTLEWKIWENYRAIRAEEAYAKQRAERIARKTMKTKRKYSKKDRKDFTE
ncbi:MAG: ribosome small subunit-dependent GTPase A [Roseburia sp.]